MKWNELEWNRGACSNEIAWTGPRLCPMACSNRPASGPSVRRHRLPIDIYDPSNTVGIQSSDVHRDWNTSLFTCVKTMGRNKQVSCKICYKPMRSDNVTKHMKIHLKYTAEEGSDNICKEILLDLVDKVLEENRSDVKINCGEHDDAYLEPEL